MEDTNSGTESTRLEMPKAKVELFQQPEVQAALDKMAEAVTKSVNVPPDHYVWLNIFCAVASCTNSDRATSLLWADNGLEEFRRRFPR